MPKTSRARYEWGLFFTLSAILLPGCSSASAASTINSINQRSHAELGYTDSIKNLANTATSVVDQGIAEFNSETLPHQAKDLRKQIVRLRDILDVFSHNFAHELELWDSVRDGLDDGYTVVGDFKDLFDTNPDATRALDEGADPVYKDQKKLAARRERVLAWKAGYLAAGGLKDNITQLFLDIRELNAENTINSKKYSDFFWGGVSLRPLQGSSPAQNARRLVNAQSDLAIAEHPDVLDIKDPSTEKNELLFHDHRKRLRTIAKVCNVANLISTDTCNSAAVKDVESLVVKLGEIEDLIITGRHLEEDGEKKQAKDAYEDAKKKFKDLKKRYDGKNMIEALERL